jgi:threonine aldolase
MSPPRVDLVSDTATRPTPGMYEAMAKAELGDEQKGEDPTVNALEARAAALLGQERAMFLPSATMANQIALALWCKGGDEVLCHKSAHVFNYETGGTAINGRAQIHILEGERGLLTADDVRARLRVDDPHLPETRVVVVENTSNGGGGTVWPDAHFDGVADLCDEHGLQLHIDGARLMNASVKAGVEPSRWGRRAASVQMCFSKGLGCPFGAVLAFGDAHWRWVRRRKQAMGGCFRQAGVIAGAMLYALDHHVELLAEDHRRAAMLGEGLAAIDGLEVEPVETNLVFFRVQREGWDAARLCGAMLKDSVRMAPTPDGRIRACLHLDVDDAGVELALKSAAAALA